LYELDRETFNNIVKDAAQNKREKYEEFLGKVPLLNGMDTYERAKIADCIKETTF
jgi:cAMP-dependent protein kinase regulator